MSVTSSARARLTGYAAFGGRSGRLSFWRVQAVLMLLLSGAGELAARGSPLLGGVLALALLPPWLAVGARRLRDAGLTPWWLLLAAVPILGVPLLLLPLSLPSARPSRGLALA